MAKKCDNESKMSINFNLFHKKVLLFSTNAQTCLNNVTFYEKANFKFRIRRRHDRRNCNSM